MLPAYADFLQTMLVKSVNYPGFFQNWRNPGFCNAQRDKPLQSVSVYNGAYEEFLIIDGQQRVTTISLLLLAIHNILKEGKLASVNGKLAEKVFNNYLVDAYSPSERRIKLKAVNRDRDAFDRLFEEKPSEYIPN